MSFSNLSRRLSRTQKLSTGSLVNGEDASVTTAIELQNHQGKANRQENRRFTVPIAEILSGKNARAWVSMGLYLKK